MLQSAKTLQGACIKGLEIDRDGMGTTLFEGGKRPDCEAWLHGNSDKRRQAALDNLLVKVAHDRRADGWTQMRPAWIGGKRKGK